MAATGPSPPPYIKDEFGNWIKNPAYKVFTIQSYGFSNEKPEYDAIKQAADSGMLLVFAAGNDRQLQPVTSVNPSGSRSIHTYDPATREAVSTNS